MLFFTGHSFYLAKQYRSIDIDRSIDEKNIYERGVTPIPPYALSLPPRAKKAKFELVIACFHQPYWNSCFKN